MLRHSIFHLRPIVRSVLSVAVISAAHLAYSQPKQGPVPVVSPTSSTSTDAISAPTAGAQSLVALQRMIDRGQFAEAVKQLDPIASQQPVPSGVKRLQGEAYYATNRFTDADAAFAEAVAQDPKDLESLQMRGLTLFRMGKPADAIPLLTQAQAWGSQTKIDPNYVLALCYLDTRRYDDARRSFAAQYAFEPDSARSYLLAARMLFRRDYVPIAQQYAHKAIELDPQIPLAHGLLGEAALASNHLDEAVAEFESERARNPLEASTYDRLGDTYLRLGNYQTARQFLQRAVLLEPNATGPYILLGKTLLKLQSPANALLYLEKAEAMDPSNFMTHGLLGQAYRGVGRLEDATRETDISQKLQADNQPKLQGLQ